MAPKSVFRQPGVQHFQLVHRSQRDPLIHDPQASKHVLKSFERENVRKGKTRADPEASLPYSDIERSAARPNVGEASMYDIFYDDTEYDYMQHLRTVGAEEAGVDSVLLPAPQQSKTKSKKPKPFLKADLPAEALPSQNELERTYESQMAIPSEIAGFQPDMDLHLRQTLEALDDEAFVDDNIDDDFFGALVQDGEREPDDVVEFAFDEDGVEDEDLEASSAGPSHQDTSDDPPDESDWQSRFAKFKQSQKQDVDSQSDANSEKQDTLGGLPQLPVIGGKRRRKGASDASGYSLSSSSMFRNAGLSTLDEQFAKIEKEYASGSDEDDELGSDEDEDEDEDEDAAPELLPVRDDFDSLMEDFLDRYELVGGKIRPILEGTTGAQKLETYRKAMVEGLSRVEIRNSDSADNDDNIPMPAIVGVGAEKDRWDCETILSTYTNLENHPRLIRARAEDRVPRIRLDRRTGLPTVEVELGARAQEPVEDLRRQAVLEEVLGSDVKSREPRATIARSKDETKEEKKARKQAVKEERQQRRVEKKIMKDTFQTERKIQQKVQKDKQVATRKL